MVMFANARVKRRLHEAFQQDKEFSAEQMEGLNPTKSRSINAALNFIRNPSKMCERIHLLIGKLNGFIKDKSEDSKTKGNTKWAL